ncbi:MAG: TonB-dependent receptor plug domain-containing protein, partial [Fibrobacter sp.]|nr:TonB-dependent receptor plug domain-containing protein [Fibrobacter sp.]
MFIYKAATLALIFATVGAVSVRAQDDEITSIDDFLEESAPENNATTDDANDMARSEASAANASGVTQLDELSVESEIEAEQAKQAKKAESVATIDAAEMQNTSKTVSKAVNSASGVKVRKSGGMGSEGKINIRGMEGKNIKVLVNGVPVETQGNLGLDDIPIDQIADIEVYKGYVPARFATDGAGGAINIITKKRPANSVDASYSLSSF